MFIQVVIGMELTLANANTAMLAKIVHFMVDVRSVLLPLTVLFL